MNNTAAAVLPDNETVTLENAASVAAGFLDKLGPYPDRFAGAGVLTVLSDIADFTTIWVNFYVLRQLGCALPVQIWFQGDKRLSTELTGLLGSLQVECVCADQIRLRYPARYLNDWELVPYAVLNCSFETVVYIAPDSMPVATPEQLLDSEAFKKYGAMFWRQACVPKVTSDLWKAVGLEPRIDREFDGGQFAVDKSRCWQAVNLAWWYNDHSDLIYHYTYGYRDTFRLALTKTDTPFHAPDRVAERTNGLLLQRYDGRRVAFQNGFNWDYFNDECPDGLHHKDLGVRGLTELRQRWSGLACVPRRWAPAGRTERMQFAAYTLCEAVFMYERVGYDKREMAFCVDGTIGLGSGGREILWDLLEADDSLTLEIWSDNSLTCILSPKITGVWEGQWVDSEQMPVALCPIEQTLPGSFEDYVSTACPASGRRRSLMQSLQLLNQLKLSESVIVEIGSIRDSRLKARDEDGWSTVVFGWFSHTFGGACHTVDKSDFHIDVCRRVTEAYADAIHYHHAEGIDFLSNFAGRIDLLYLDLDHMGYLACYEALTNRPAIITVPGFATNLAGPDRFLLPRLKSDGYILADVAYGQASFVSDAHRDSIRNLEDLPNFADIIDRPSPSHMFTRTHVARVYTHDHGGFSDVNNSSVLLYWPHGFGDWIFLSHIIPLMNPTNEYFVTRFGDDTNALFDRNPYATPIYSGTNSPHCDDGSVFGNQHFGLHYDGVNGNETRLQVPLSMEDQWDAGKINTILWSFNPESHGHTPFPFHTKGRNLLKHLVKREALPDIILNKPLASAVSFDVDPWVTTWVESRLTSFGGFGDRKLCIISRSGYTGLDKNWGHIARQDMPAGKQREGEECRDFMRLMLKKDRRWMFLLMEDMLMEGEQNLCSEELHAYSYAQLFTSTPGGAPPFALVLKVLTNVASLEVGVPTGPYHLAMIKPELPTVGVWIAHLPDWYDEPKSNAIHLVSRNVIDKGYHNRPGSNIHLEGYRHNKRQMDTTFVAGQDVLSAVEELIY